MTTNTNALKAAAKGNTAVKERTPADNLAALLAKDSVKKQMALALPKHLTADRLARIATTEIRRVPALGTCSPESFLGAIMQCGQLGLEPSNGLGQAYLIPFGNGKDKQGRANVQLIIGYRGMIDLARRSGQIISLSARAVYENDEFSYEYGLHEDLKHKPYEDGDSGALTHVYAVAKLKDGGVQFEVMSRKQIEAIRAQSKAASTGPWVTHFDEMAKKTVIRRLFKYLPVSIEIQRAVGLDEQAEAGIDQRNDTFFETGEYVEADYIVVEPQATPEKAVLSEQEFEAVLNDISTGNISIEQVQAQYALTDEQQTQINKL
ncbi:recombination protein RecT [Kingella negevensis]|uniref:recombination protein RecT n=1 Tax=Kingella TaxID=32257 RepID=UPI000A26749D|nr:recombination protein RecT [Kingella negevensis]MDK4688542.1 recombination protein RecT [Kingella negevensis]MDK4689749.1 recombination protein RecT [Kingella negevensis]WII91714.1 recombination protein RecT [Kingella negevensis]